MLDFLWSPALLGLLGVPLLAWLVLARQRRRGRYAFRLSTLRFVAQAGAGVRSWRRLAPIGLYLLAITCWTVAVARPTVVVATPQSQQVVFLVMDVSASMILSDVPPNRMIAAQEAAKTFVNSMPDGVRVGLVTFSDNAQLVVPPTLDRRSVVGAIDQLVTQTSTAIGEGIKAATEAAMQVRNATRDTLGQDESFTIVLLSDGESNTGLPPLEAVEGARDAGATIFTVGLVGGASSPAAGAVDEATLRKLADLTNGRYFRASDSEQLSTIYGDLGRSIVVERRQVELSALAVGLGLLASLGAIGLRYWTSPLL